MRLAKVDSHHQFVSTCLRNHVIPGRLHIKIKPCVPKSSNWNYVARLVKEWAQISRRTTRGFLEAMKCYHSSCARSLWFQVSNLETSMINQLGRRVATTIDSSETVCNNWTNRLRTQQRRKLDKLLPLETRTQLAFHYWQKQRRRRFRKKIATSEKVQIMGQPTTIINLSSVPLSGAEVSLLSKGLSFRPTPRRLNKPGRSGEIFHVVTPGRILFGRTGWRGRKWDEHKVSLPKQLDAS